ncbi:MAG: ferritin [Treponema sp.]|jgi:ferritin|nr:ferritin [Treponema sp.]
MITEKMVKVLSDQANAEFYSAYLYLAMSACADNAKFRGIANWLYVQAREEQAHGTHIVKYLLERGAVPVFDSIKAPEASWGNMVELFEKVTAHEKYVTGLINKIADLALEEKDHATYNFILWYVNEQIEEVAEAEEILARVKLTGDHHGQIYHLDSVLGARKFKDPFSD